MRSVRPVFWDSGQFLDPQHFQQADSHHYQQRAASFTTSQPWPWGVSRLEIDEAALATGLIKVTRAELLFPDGTWAVVDPQRNDGNAVIESRALDPLWTDRHEPFTLRVGLARLSAKGNVAGVLEPQSIAENRLPAAAGRYVAAESDEMLVDRYALPHPSLPDSGAPVRTLYYYLRLFSPEESRSRGDHYHFPIIRLKDQSLGPRLDPNWCPPLINISANPGLLRAAAGFESRLAALTGHLAPGRPASLYAPVPGGLATLLSATATTLADLRLLLARPDAQPWELFGLLCRGLAAMSAALKIEGDMPALSGAVRFDHDSPLESLATLEGHYRRLLSRVLPEIVAEMPFAARDELLVATLTAEVAASYLEPLIMIKLDEPVGELLAEGRLLAGSPADVREAMHRAVPALPLKPVRPPAGLPGGSAWRYLKPDRSSAAWKRVLAEGELALAVLSGPGRPSADLAANSKVIFIKAAGAEGGK
jgi:type VI secretion system protein ImpJ